MQFNVLREPLQQQVMKILFTLLILEYGTYFQGELFCFYFYFDGLERE